MHRFEVSIEVGPIDLAVVERLKSAGYAVYRGAKSWRVESTQPVIGKDSIRAQAHVFVHDTIREFGLHPLAEPPAYTLRDPDAGMDDRPDLVLKDAEKAYDPPPLERPKGRWFQTPQELKGGERER